MSMLRSRIMLGCLHAREQCMLSKHPEKPREQEQCASWTNNALETGEDFEFAKCSLAEKAMLKGRHLLDRHSITRQCVHGRYHHAVSTLALIKKKGANLNNNRHQGGKKKAASKTNEAEVRVARRDIKFLLLDLHEVDIIATSEQRWARREKRKLAKHGSKAQQQKKRKRKKPFPSPGPFPSVGRQRRRLKEERRWRRRGLCAVEATHKTSFATSAAKTQFRFLF